MRFAGVVLLAAYLHGVMPRVSPTDTQSNLTVCAVRPLRPVGWFKPESHQRHRTAQEDVIKRSARPSRPGGKDGFVHTRCLGIALVVHLLPASVDAQTRPDFSGVWRLLPAESQMIGGGGPPSEDYQLTWLVDHRDPEINVVVNVRDGQGSQEYSFRCMTDGTECVNELPRLGETRRLVAVWEGTVLVMSQRAITPQGGFETRDRLSASGDRLIFERVITNDRGKRTVRQVFRKLGPHSSQRPPPEPLPSVSLPDELERVLRDYERHWRDGNAERLAALFTEDGMVARRGAWIRGQQALRAALQRTSSDLRLRAVVYAVDGRVGYIIGAYGYGDQPASYDRGLFILTLRQRKDGHWLIVADLDGAIRQ